MQAPQSRGGGGHPKGGRLAWGRGQTLWAPAHGYNTLGRCSKYALQASSIHWEGVPTFRHPPPPHTEESVGAKKKKQRREAPSLPGPWEEALGWKSRGSIAALRGCEVAGEGEQGLQGPRLHEPPTWVWWRSPTFLPQPTQMCCWPKPRSPRALPKQDVL